MSGVRAHRSAHTLGEKAPSEGAGPRLTATGTDLTNTTPAPANCYVMTFQEDQGMGDVAEQGVPTDGRRFLSLTEASLYSSLSLSTLRRLVEGGKLSSYRPTGRRVLLDRQELDRLILASGAAATA
jgi:excisionase family DNA binding protein